MSRGDARLFDDWEFLAQISNDLNRVAQANSIDIRLSSAAKRSQAIDLLLRKRSDTTNPDSWNELADFLFSNMELDAAIRKYLRTFGRNTQSVVDSIKSDLFFICLRNAEKWVAHPERKATWRGLVFARIQELADRHLPKGAETSLKIDVPDESIEWVEKAESHDRLERAIDQLDQAHQRLIKLHFFEQKRVSEIARILKIPYSTASDRLEKAVVLMRIELAKPGFN